MNGRGNDKFMQIQHQIRQNSYSVQDYISELTEWTEDINEKDKNAKVGKGIKVPSKKLPPIRSDKLEQERVKSNKSGSYLDSVKTKDNQQSVKKEETKVNEESKDFKRDITPMPKYYNKWDQFDPKTAIEEVEKDANIGFDKTIAKSGEEISKTSSNPAMYEPSEYDNLTEEERKELEKEKFLKGTSGAKPNTQIVIKGGNTPTPQSQIESMKKKGNSFYTSLEYEKAIE